MSYRDLRALSRLIDSSPFLGGSSLWQPPQALYEYDASTAGFPAVSVEEKGDCYEITADVPSFKKEDIKVHLGDSNRRLILEAETRSVEKLEPPIDGTAKEQAEQDKEEAEAKGGEKSSEVAKRDGANQVSKPAQTFLINERQTYSSFRRAFHFNTPLDPKSLKAKLEDGQLKVSVLKAKEDEGVHSVEVE